MSAKKKRVYPKKTDREVWHEDRVDTLATLWARGFPAANIAVRMGVTKSMVVGIAKRRRDAGDLRFPNRLVEEPEDKEGVRESLARKIREMIGPVRWGDASAEAKRLGMHPSEFSLVVNGLGLEKFSPAKLLQILHKVGAEVQVDATITSNGRSEVVVLPLHERSPI